MACNIMVGENLNIFFLLTEWIERRKCSCEEAELRHSVQHNPIHINSTTINGTSINHQSCQYRYGSADVFEHGTENSLSSSNAAMCMCE